MSWLKIPFDFRNATARSISYPSLIGPMRQTIHDKTSDKLIKIIGIETTRYLMFRSNLTTNNVVVADVYAV